MNNQDYLIHYGVLGMRWGHRKQRARSLGSGRRSSMLKKNMTSSRVSKSSSKKKVSKKSVQKGLNRINKQKVKSVAKTAGKAAAITALGVLGATTIGAVAHNAYITYRDLNTLGPRIGGITLMNTKTYFHKYRPTMLTPLTPPFGSYIDYTK